MAVRAGFQEAQWHGFATSLPQVQKDRLGHWRIPAGFCEWFSVAKMAFPSVILSNYVYNSLILFMERVKGIEPS
ncbi:hypothetical protein GCM10011247_38550 [Pseudomonas plecoglossicida]|nr:hypothetical protein GCM10011247_38550 [Pseudomonas plecoglossicida]